MQQKLGEERIKQLFRELRQEDEQGAPSFEGVLKTGSPKAAQASPVWSSLKVAVAAAVPVLASGLVFILLRQASVPPSGAESSKSSPPVAVPSNRTEPLPYEPPIPSIEHDPAPGAIGRGSARAIRPSRSTARHHQPAMLISRWQSPTDFLLKTPGDRLLKTIPRTGDSIIEIKPINPDEMN
jgi:hypothetical protein